MRSIIIPVKFSLGDIIKASFAASFLRPFMLVIMSLALLGFIFFYPIFFVRFWSFWIFIALPLWVLFLSWRNYKTNPLMREQQEFEISDSGIKVKGETFSMQREWTSIHKVSSKGTFIFIGLTKRVSYPLPRAKFSDDDFNRLYEIVNAQQHVKNGLKKKAE